MSSTCGLVIYKSGRALKRPPLKELNSSAGDLLVRKLFKACDKGTLGRWLLNFEILFQAVLYCLSPSKTSQRSVSSTDRYERNSSLPFDKNICVYWVGKRINTLIK